MKVFEETARGAMELPRDAVCEVRNLLRNCLIEESPHTDNEKRGLALAEHCRHVWLNAEFETPSNVQKRREFLEGFIPLYERFCNAQPTNSRMGEVYRIQF